ncbi:MAG: hypothetical protein RL557_59 [archaeon]|jgi:protein-disulfide isomerase
MSEEGSITIKKQDLWKYSTFILLAVLVIGGIYMYSGKGTTGTNPIIPPGNNPPTEPSKVSASVDDDAILGNKNAPVTIIEFSDYQCPFCERFWSQTLPEIKKEYIDTGKVKFVYRDFPLESIHPMAMPAAIATECVKEAGGDAAFWKMHDKIFGNQQSLSVANLKSWAKEIGYDIDSCLDNQETLNEIKKDMTDAQAAGTRGTPYFVINDKPLSGAQPFSAFKQVIDAELA